tara:strand:+ start:943 stop:2505 length:1563 start_codon:yes stop_codon:yes gene_type:complete
VKRKKKGNIMAQAEKKTLTLPPRPLLKKAKLAFQKGLKLDQKGSTVLVSQSSLKDVKKLLNDHLFSWQLDLLKDGSSKPFHFQTETGSLDVILLEKNSKKESKSHHGLLQESLYTKARDAVGNFLTKRDQKRKSITIHFENLEKEALRGSMVGLEMGAYDYVENFALPNLSLIYQGNKLKKEEVKAIHKEAHLLGEGINLARELVNTPSGFKTPGAYSKALTKLFKNIPNVKINVWNEARLKKEKMGLILGVGGGASEKPCMVHIQYRPKKLVKSKELKGPIALVGKGITFDSGGLDIKPSGAMRNMKKDMGGSACMVGTAYYLTQSQAGVPCDFYLPLAENAIDALSFRPGDILHARNGKTVEIHNTDAEGRLVLGDALDVAVTQKGKDKPCMVVDAATLTGAIKVGLGSSIGGLFSNDDKLAASLEKAAQGAGDPLWRMPLDQSLRAKMKSHVADMTNAVDGFGGAITAALFLESFVGETPWAHMDLYAWVDGPKGPYSRAGANGQGVQTLAHFLNQF